jgi:predicted phosphoadenosine phosphosulfate sulfurtransferase
MKNKIIRYIRKWEKQGYENGIPDEAPAKLEALNKVPSYRMICKAILKNDLALISLGFSKPKSKAYSMLKRIELNERIRSIAAKIKNDI